MDWIGLSVRRPVFAWVLLFAIVMFGLLALRKLGVSQMPDLDFPVLNISVGFEGAAPQVVETEILDPIEERLLSIEGVEKMSSSARQGAGSVTLEFNINRDINQALQEVQAALSQLRLPTGVDPPVIRKQNPEEDPIVILSVSSATANTRDLLLWVDQFVLDELRFLPGVGEVSVGGFSERNLRIWLDRNKLESYELTVLDVVEALRSQHLESAAGQFTQGSRELRVRWLGEAASVAEVSNIRILRRGGREIFDRVIKISDVARVEDGLSDIRRVARFDGKPAVGIQIRKQRGTNEVDVAQSVLSKMETISKRFPEGYSYRVNLDFTQSTKSTVDLTVSKLWGAALITILVCFLFLGSISSAINILFSIPFSIVGTFVVLYVAGFTLNLFTLLALTLSISIVVDDAIMLLENIFRHRSMGKSPTDAAIEGAREVMPAAIAATLAVVAVFLPVVFMSGVVGKFFLQFGITMTVAVLLSLVEASTITPMRAAAILATQPKATRLEKWLEEQFHRLGQSYKKTLEWSLSNKTLVLIGSTLFFVASLAVFPKLRKEFVPPQDQNIILVSGQTPPGTSLDKTNAAATLVEKVLEAQPEVEGFFTSVGAGGGGASQVNQMFFPVTLKPKNMREKTHTQVMNELREKFKAVPGVRLTMRDISTRNLSSGRPSPIAVNLRGPDMAELQRVAKLVMQKLEQENLGVDMDTDYREGLPELTIQPDRQALASRNVSVESVGNVIATAVGGLRLGRITSEGDRFDIRFKLEDSQLLSSDDLKKLYVRNASGNLIRLSDVVKVEESSAAQAISRVNRARSISVFGNLAPSVSQAVALQRAQEVARENLPSGYTVNLEGASAGFSESFQSLYGALWIGILVAYLILAVQFNSFVHPVSILAALPFGASGAFLSLWAFNQSLNLFSMIGLLVLMGIAKKNSILLVEFTQHLRSGGASVRSALLEACPVRLRPILMTSVATVAAALPLLLPGGIGSETRIPMGLTIVGGTIVSTVLTLFVVPALFEALSGIRTNNKVTP